MSFIAVNGVVEDTKASASILIAFLPQRSGQKKHNALYGFTFFSELGFCLLAEFIDVNDINASYR